MVETSKQNKGQKSPQSQQRKNNSRRAMNAPRGHENQKRSMLKQYATYCITSATCCMDQRRPVTDKR